ncbi:fimbrial protein [Aeromonas simiae]|uniref:fimbrial protein n=1 Tax=Aeromonas simiae TaxID=218936 RepID=UPI0005A95E0C|nr:fimbrial protein [Aeromonas simiae]MDO2949510.1 type 1 fimbrial protein [Aeromonas simiae]MDO2953174.1 type 1 fimbrial protein [Aeromonas simiae]MDO2956841.1 type 1 fimbrial protein [Aeromonas simiae]
MFKKSLLAALTVLAVNNAYAITDTGVPGGTITFNGSVTDTTCNITTSNGADFSVQLSPVTVSSVGTDVGLVNEGSKAFTMAVSDCSSTNDEATALKITFSSSNVSDDEKYLKNYSGTATGVGIALTSDGKTMIPFNTTHDTGLKKTDFANAGETKSLTYYANYYNFGGTDVTAGSVVTAATYTFSYE